MLVKGQLAYLVKDMERIEKTIGEYNLPLIGRVKLQENSGPESYLKKEGKYFFLDSEEGHVVLRKFSSMEDLKDVVTNYFEEKRAELNNQIFKLNSEAKSLEIIANTISNFGLEEASKKYQTLNNLEGGNK